jgi:hypothetical protein
LAVSRGTDIPFLAWGPDSNREWWRLMSQSTGFAISASRARELTETSKLDYSLVNARHSTQDHTVICRMKPELWNLYRLK